jgi:hypothetical protein
MPLRLRGLIRGHGRHRAPRATDRPPLLDEATLDELMEDGEVEAIEEAWCPGEQRTRPHAMHNDGSRSCFECQHTTASDQ